MLKVNTSNKYGYAYVGAAPSEGCKPGKCVTDTGLAFALDGTCRFQGKKHHGGGRERAFEPGERVKLVYVASTQTVELWSARGDGEEEEMRQQYSGVPVSWRFAVGCAYCHTQFEIAAVELCTSASETQTVPEEEAAERLARQAVKPTAKAHAIQQLDPVPEPEPEPEPEAEPEPNARESEPPDAPATIAPVPVSEAAFPSRTEANLEAGVSTRFECANEKDVKNLKEMAEDGQSVKCHAAITVYASPPFSQMQGKPSPEHPP